MRPDHYRLVGQTAVPCTLMEWAAQFEDIDQRRVALTRIGPFEVSTVFLGLDHNWSHAGPPLLFETMTFANGEFDGNDKDGRTSTWSEAEARHRAAVEFLQLNHCAPGEQPEEAAGPVAPEPQAKPKPDVP